MASHYNESYFSYQKHIGEFGAWANLTKFAEYVKPTDAVLDFGCGSGGLLAALSCESRVGVEVNPAAREVAATRLNVVYPSASDVPSASVDTVISNHALEHTARPLDELRELYRALKPGGAIVIVVPSETYMFHYIPGDPNHHLYTWSPMCLGNLLTEAGFSVDWAKPFIHKWPPRTYKKWGRYGRRVFDAVCRVYGLTTPRMAQVRALARKPL